MLDRSWRPKLIGWPKSWAKTVVSIMDRLDAVTPQEGTNVSIADIVAGGGKEISVKTSSGISPPFNDLAMYDSGGGKLGIDNGTVGGELPTGMTAGATRGSVDAYTHAVTGSGIAYVIVTVDTSTHAILTRTFGFGASVPADTEDTGHVSLGDYTNTAGVITIGSGKQGIGSQSYLYDRWRAWFSSPVTYSHAHQFGPA